MTGDMTMFIQKILTILLFLQTGQTGIAQTLVFPKLKGELPSSLQESSGLLIQSPDTLWSHNDSGNNAKLYAFNTKGKDLMDRKIGDVSDKDWEEITKDDQGHIFIGDFGNNNNDREDLLILRISSDISDKKTDIVVDSILFTYEDQTLFPPPGSSLNFDCEAMVTMNDSIFLFTKDRTDPYLSQTLMYVLSAQPGTQVAKYKGTFLTNVPIFLQGSITGAALSPDKKTLVLMGYPRMWVFKNFPGTDFFSGKLTVLQFDSYSQKEGVAFLDNCTVYITDEVNPVLSNGGNLYELNLCDYITTTSDLQAKNFKVYPNPSSNEISINYSVSFQPQFLTVYNPTGKIVYQITLKSNKEEINIPKDVLSNIGLYPFTITDKSGQIRISDKILIQK